MQKPHISIIIVDYKKNNPYLIECLEAIEKQTYKNYKIILVTDYPVPLPHLSNLTQKSFGHYVGPAQKRDWGAKKARGEILAFIDDDAYPHKDWLKNMIRSFSQKNIAAVGGPGITPPKTSWQEQASGWMSASPLGAGPYTYRFLPGKKQFVDDYPSMNLAVRKVDFLAVGGYDSNYWPGEDTKLCLDLINLNKKIIYDPKVVVYHHRRPLWQPHLRQNGNFGLHRGFFARILPQTSLRPVYLGPPFMVLGFLYIVIYSIFPLCIHGEGCQYSGWVRLFPSIYDLGIVLFVVYLILVAFNSYWVFKKSTSFLQGLISFPVVFITHFWYGIRFLQGFFFTRSLTR